MSDRLAEISDRNLDALLQEDAMSQDQRDINWLLGRIAQLEAALKDIVEGPKPPVVIVRMSEGHKWCRDRARAALSSPETP